MQYLNSKASLGCAVAIKASSCITYAIFFLNDTGLISCPATLTQPSILIPVVDADLPASTFNNEDFPEPIH